MLFRRKIFYFALLSLLLLAGTTHAQVITLLRGHAFSEEEAKEKLATLAESYPDRESWEARAEMLRAGVRRGMELDRLPPPCELNPIRHSLREMDGYTVENVAFESLPGFWVTGNLYLPAESEGKIPGILNPHGHWPNARLQEMVQARCAAQARMGAAAFAYDLVGHGDSQPCEHRCYQVQRLQTYNSMRALDFLLSLGMVDKDRLAITGGSGGGTQTFLLAAVDDRIAVSVPVVMVSAHFYGGCECESGMPIHKTADYETNNVEIAALVAPKPLMLISNGKDWTSNNPQVEFPHVEKIYSLFDAGEHVENAHFPEEGHDYGPSKRAAAHPFLAKHLGLDLGAIKNEAGEIDESFFIPVAEEELRVFNDEHPRPEHAVKRCEDVIGLLNRRE